MPERPVSLFSFYFYFSSLLLLSLFFFLLSVGTMGSRWELRHLTGSPGAGGNKGLSYSS